MIKYIGSKRTLLPEILATIKSIPKARSVLDLFSGTSRVGHALKRSGFRVTANDHNAYAATLARCYVQSDRGSVLKDATRLIEEFNRTPGVYGYFTKTFCEDARFIHPTNGERIDAIRCAIAAKGLPPELESVLLVSLMLAADRVDSTTGVQMAYLKQWAPRARNELELRLPDLLPRARPGKGIASQRDALTAARRYRADVAYIDPPYNQHSYLGNYHMWETLVLWDSPEVYGVARKRIDCKERKSPFNSKPRAEAALAAVIKAVRSKVLVVSFSNEGFVSRPAIEAMLAERGTVITLEKDCKRYVGAQIGIHNQDGQVVGEVSHLRNKERLYIAGDYDPNVLRNGPLQAMITQRKLIEV